MELYDLTGKKLIEQKGKSLDVSKLVESEYLLKVKDEASNEEKTFKIIKN